MDEHERGIRFTYHPPVSNQSVKYEKMRGMAKEVSKFIDLLSPSSRERSIAQVKLDEMVFWVDAAIARRE